MVLFIEVLEGPQQGSRFKIEQGHKIGRKRGEIAIDDEKISSEHAQFVLDNKGQFVLIDLESSNGILIANRRLKKIAMMPGVVFRLGRTDFRVIAVEVPEAQDFARLRTWRENLVEKLPIDWIQNKLSEETGLPFSPTLKLKFIQGIQADESLLLGYGPRRAGANSLDIDLRDPEAPDLAFEIIPGDGLAKIKNLCLDKLRLNNKLIETEVLQDGDLIRIGRTLIEVTYI
jgi:pSer/pThr/pTyr-binding forkhead associated (FHA) protein